MNIHSSKSRFISMIFLVFFLGGCSWHNETEQSAIYNCIFDCWTAGNVLNPDYNDTTGKKIEGYINYLPYFSPTRALTNWTFDYSKQATMLTTLADGSAIQHSGTYYSPSANIGTIEIPIETGETVTLTWNDAFVDGSGNKSHAYFEFYTSRIYHIEALGGDVTVWMLYHSRRVW